MIWTKMVEGHRSEVWHEQHNHQNSLFKYDFFFVYLFVCYFGVFLRLLNW